MGYGITFVERKINFRMRMIVRNTARLARVRFAVSTFMVTNNNGKTGRLKVPIGCLGSKKRNANY